MKTYLDIVRRILTEGEQKSNRTGVDTIAIAGAMFEHDMAKGFPLLTTKKVPFKNVASELEFFIKGITDKKWLWDRNNHIWDEWANPKKAPYGHDEAAKKRMMEERDLGPVYGFQWRHFGATYNTYDTDYTGQGIDQLKKVIETIRTNPNDRRMIVNSWNPACMPEWGLPPCHYSYQITIINGKLNLLWNQRSVDTMLGLPFNIASYGLLLHLLAKETGLQEGRLVGFLADVHIYVNHVEGAKEQLTRDPNKYPLPKIETRLPTTEGATNGGQAEKFSIFDWTSGDSNIVGYESYPKIAFEIAV